MYRTSIFYIDPTDVKQDIEKEEGEREKTRSTSDHWMFQRLNLDFNLIFCLELLARSRANNIKGVLCVIRASSEDSNFSQDSCDVLKKSRKLLS